MNRFSLSLVAGLCLLAACSPSSGPVTADVAARTRTTDFRLELPGEGPVATAVTPGLNTLDFGSQAGCSPKVMTLLLSHSGSGFARTLRFVSTQGPFTVTGITGYNTNPDGGANPDGGVNTVSLPVAIGPGESLTLSIAFSPQGPGPVTGSLLLFLDDDDQASFTVTLQGSGSGAFLELDSTSLDFGNHSTAAASGATRKLTLSNPGTAQVSVSSISATSPFSVPTAAFTIDAGRSREVTVTFTPTEIRAYTGSLLLVSTAVCPHAAGVALSGSGVDAAALQLSPTALTFEDQFMGVSGVSQVVTVRNNANTELRVTEIEIINKGNTSTNNDFAVSPVGAFNLSPGASRQLAVKFTPRSAGLQEARLAVTGTHQSTPTTTTTRTVALTGTAVAATTSFKFEPGTLTFAAQKAGTTSAEEIVTVTNTGATTVALTAITAPARFSVTPSSLSIAPGGTEQLKVRFVPAEADSGAYSGQVTFNHAPTMTSPPTLSLQGTAVKRTVALSFTPGNLTFESQKAGTSSTAKVVTVTNTGERTLDLTAIGASTAKFSVTPNSLNIPPGGERDLLVTFSPAEADSGVYSAQLTFTPSLALDSNITLPLQGTALKRTSALSFSPSNLTFESQKAGTSSAAKVVTVTNTGDRTLDLTGIGASTAKFSVTPNSLNIPPGGQRDLLVTFSPLEADSGSLSAQLTFTPTPALDSTPTFPLQGTASRSPSSVTFSPSTVVFGEQKAGTTREPIRVLVTNNSADRSVDITGITASNANFSVTPTSLTIPPSGSRELLVNFNPSASAASGALSGQLTLTNALPLLDPPFAIGVEGKVVRTTLTVFTNEINFGDHVVGTEAATAEVTLTNPTSMPVQAYPVTMPVGGAFDATVTPLNIPAGGSSTLRVWFDPSTAGSIQQLLTIQTDANDPPPSVTLKGRGISSSLSINPTSVTFADQAVNVEVSQNVTLSNAGTAPLTVTKAAIAASAQSAHFSIRGLSLPVTVAPLSTGPTFQVVFRPTTAGTLLEARLEFFTGETVFTPLSPSLRLSGKAFGPSPTFDPDQVVNFGPQRVGVDAVRSVRISNSQGATANLKLLSAEATYPFSVDAIPTTVAPLTPGGTPYVLRVHFNPPSQTVEPTKGTLRIFYEGSSEPHVIELEGQGVQSQLVLSRKTVDFGEVSIGTQESIDVKLTNEGLAPLNLQTVKFENADGGTTAFSFRNLTWPQEIGAGVSTTFQVAFLPTGSAALTTALVIESDSAGGFLRLPVSGTGAFALASPRPTSLAFGNVRKGTPSEPQRITIQNTGTAVLDIQRVTADGPFAVLEPAGGWPQRVQASETLIIEVIFTPEQQDHVAGELSILSNSRDGEVNVPLDGTGTVSVLAVVPASVDFQNRRVGTLSEAVRVSLQNNGKADLNIAAFSVTAPFCLPPIPVFTSTPDAGTPADAGPPPTDAGSGGADGGTPTDGGTNAGSDCLQNRSGPIRIPPSQSALLDLRVKPENLGANPGVLTIVSDVVGNLTTVPLTVNGTGGMEVAPGTLNFGSVNLLASPVEQQVIVTNSGLSPERITSITFDPPGEFSLKNSLPIPMAAGANQTLTVVFDPKGNMVGPRAARATIQMENASTQPVNLNLLGAASSPRLEVARKDGAAFGYKVSFGGVRKDTSSVPVILTITNKNDGTTGALTLRDIVVEGRNADRFVLSKPSLASPVEVGGTVELGLEFVPNANQNFAATLRVTSDDVLNPSVLVELTGQGVNSAIQASDSLLDFGAQVAELPTQTRTVLFTNTSFQPVSLTNLQVVGLDGDAASEPTHFRLEEQPPRPYILEPGKSLSVPVKFIPRPDVTSKAVLRVSTDLATDPVVAVDLRGKGLSTVFRTLKRTVDFGTLRQSEVATQKVELTNDSSQSIVLLPPAIEGPQAYNFTLTSAPIPATGRTLQPGDSYSMEFKYDTTQVSTSEATLVLKTEAQPEGAARVTFQGKTVSSFLSVEPLEVDFDWVDLGTPSEPRTITLTNQSGKAMRVSLLQNTNSVFEVDTSELGAEIAPGGQAQLRVKFLSNAGGETTGELHLALNASTTADVAIKLKGKARTLEGEGGGCACGAGGGGASLLGLLGLVALRARRRSQED